MVLFLCGGGGLGRSVLMNGDGTVYGAAGDDGRR
jgi:hypothetical protein